MSSRICIILCILKIFSDISALVELPQVEDNNIIETDKTVRKTTNTLFSILKLKVNGRPTLKRYSVIHNYLVSTSLHVHFNLREIAKRTRVDKTKLNNHTHNFIAILNEILDEDAKHDTEIENEYVIKHIDDFLKNLYEYTSTYKYDKNNVGIISAELMKLIEKNDSLSEMYYNGTFDYDDKSFKLSDKIDDLFDDNRFWEPSGRRIYHGKKANIEDFPFMASIQIFHHFQCAGSIIKSDLIITAASCLQLVWNNRFYRENPSFLSVRVGSTFHNTGGENVPVLEVNFHPDFEPKSLNHNLCLLRLYRLLHFTKKSNNVMKINIDRNTNPLPREMGRVTIVGWGARHRNNIVDDPYLSSAVLDYYSTQDCQRVYSPNFVSEYNFCAGFLTQVGGACNRDIGGPGIVHGTLSGVISFGSPTCGSPDAPTVFTKVAYYTDWIDEIIAQNVPANKKKISPSPPFNYYTIPSYTPIKNTFKKMSLSDEEMVLRTLNDKLLDEERILRVLNDKGLLKEYINTIMKRKTIKNVTGENKIQKLKVSKAKTHELNQHERNFFSSVTKSELYNSEMTFTNSVNNNTKTKLRYIKAGENDYETAEDEFKELSEKIYYKLSTNQNVILQKLDEGLNSKLENNIIKLIHDLNEGIEKELVINKGKLLAGKNYTRTDYDQKDSSDSSSSNETDSNERGLEIDVNTFQDLNFRNNEMHNYLISKQELSQIVSEAIKEALQEKTTKIP